MGVPACLNQPGRLTSIQLLRKSEARNLLCPVVFLLCMFARA